jgi:hypothetical protein
MKLQSPILENPDSKESLDEQSRPQLSNEKKADYVVVCCGAMIFKLLVYFLLRFIFMVLNNDDPRIVLIDRYWVSSLLFIFYITLLYALYRTYDSVTTTLSNVLFGLISLIELIFVLDTYYSEFLTISIFSLVTFFALVIILTKQNGGYSVKMASIGSLSIFIIATILVYIVCSEYVNKEPLGYLKANVFIGAFFFSMWCAVYFNEGSCMGLVNPLWTSFAFALDGFVVIETILKQVKEEFRSHEAGQEETNLMVDLPIA